MLVTPEWVAVKGLPLFQGLFQSFPWGQCPRRALPLVPHSYSSGRTHCFSETSQICFSLPEIFSKARHGYSAWACGRWKGQGIDALQKTFSLFTIWSWDEVLSSFTPWWENSLLYCFPIRIRPSHPCETGLIIRLYWLPPLPCLTCPSFLPVFWGSSLK